MSEDNFFSCIYAFNKPLKKSCTLVFVSYNFNNSYVDMHVLPLPELQNVPRKDVTLFNFSQELQKYISLSLAIEA